MTRPRLHACIILIVCCVLAGGCAISDAKNRLTLNALDRAVQDSIITNSVAGRIAAAPVAIPAGMIAGALDMTVVTPARAVGPAWKDTSACLWENPQGSDMRRMMLFVPKIVATPLLFAGDWAFRSMFDVKL